MTQRPDDPIDEPALVEALKQGRQWAFRTLVERFEARLLKLAYGMTLDREEAREIVQDAFVKAAGSMAGFRGEAGLGTWLRKITLNTSLNWRRRWKRRFRWHHLPLGPETEYLTAEKATSQATPEDRLRQKQTQERLSRAVQDLPEKLRVVFVLNALEGATYQEISDLLKISQGTVSSRLYRARQMILTQMEEKA